jgi:chaperone modulatory protein CbpM
MKMQLRLLLDQAAAQSGVPQDVIIRFVSESWITPADPQHQAFDEEDLARIRLIHDLIHTLGVNDEAVPVILHLVDQLNHLHIQLRELDR